MVKQYSDPKKKFIKDIKDSNLANTMDRKSSNFMVQHSKTCFIQALRIGILFFLALQSCYGQHTLTLTDCFNLLQQQNENIRQANIKILLEEVNVQDAKNAYLPTFSLNAGHNYNLGLAFDQVAGQLVTGNRWSKNANFSINTRIPIFQNFTLVNNLKQSLLNLEYKQVEKNSLTQTLKLEVLSKFFEAIANKALYEASLKQLEFSQEKLKIEKTKLDLETNTLIDVAQAESQVANNELNSIINLTSFSNSITHLKQLLGISLNDSLKLKIIDTLPLFQENFLSEKNVEHDPNIQLARLSIKQTELDLKYANRTKLPTISFNGGYGTMYSSERKDFLTGDNMSFFSQFNKNRNLNFGLSFSVSVFDGFKTRNNLKRLKLDLESKEIELQKKIVEREKILTLAISDFNKSVKEYQGVKKQLIALQKNYNAMNELYNAGVTTAMEFNKALLDYNIAELNTIKAKYMLIYHIEVVTLLTTSDERLN